MMIPNSNSGLDSGMELKNVDIIKQNRNVCSEYCIVGHNRSEDSL